LFCKLTTNNNCLFQTWCNPRRYKSVLRQNVATLASRCPNWRDAGRWPSLLLF